nr:uncharacterized protein LOC112709163 [Arachis hypogaea]
MEIVEEAIGLMGNGGPMTLATFLKVNPPTFRGTANPTEAIINFKPWRELCKLSRCQRTNRWSLPRIGWKEKLNSGGKELAICCSRRGGYALQHTQGRNNFRRNDNRRGNSKWKQARTQSYDLKCQRCRRYHPDKSCRAKLGLCYSCGSTGHISENRPRWGTQDASRAQQQDRVFAVTANDAARSDTLIRGNYEIGNQTLIALNDTRASHSFISFDKVEELGLKLSELAYDLHVHNPTSKL